MKLGSYETISPNKNEFISSPEIVSLSKSTKAPSLTNDVLNSLNSLNKFERCQTDHESNDFLFKKMHQDINYLKQRLDIVDNKHMKVPHHIFDITKNAENLKVDLVNENTNEEEFKSNHESEVDSHKNNIEENENIYKTKRNKYNFENFGVNLVDMKNSCPLKKMVISDNQLNTNLNHIDENIYEESTSKIKNKEQNNGDSQIQQELFKESNLRHYKRDCSIKMKWFPKSQIEENNQIYLLVTKFNEALYFTNQIAKNFDLLRNESSNLRKYEKQFVKDHIAKEKNKIHLYSPEQKNYLTVGNNMKTFNKEYIKKIKEAKVGSKIMRNVFGENDKKD